MDYKFLRTFRSSFSINFSGLPLNFPRAILQVMSRFQTTLWTSCYSGLATPKIIDSYFFCYFSTAAYFLWLWDFIVPLLSVMPITFYNFEPNRRQDSESSISTQGNWFFPLLSVLFFLGGRAVQGILFYVIYTEIHIWYFVGFT